MIAGTLINGFSGAENGIFTDQQAVSSSGPNAVIAGGLDGKIQVSVDAGRSWMKYKSQNETLSGDVYSAHITPSESLATEPTRAFVGATYGVLIETITLQPTQWRYLPEW